MKRPRHLYFVDRGRECPPWHRAPYHRYLVCTEVGRAYQEAGSTHDRAWVWFREGAADDAAGWLLLRWQGLDVDHGSVVRGGELPDGTPLGFSHPGVGRPPWPSLSHAVWWSPCELPVWLASRGVLPLVDVFSLSAVARPAESPRGPKRRYVWPGAESQALADWLEERGHDSAAADFRRQFGPREPSLFPEASRE